jgi:hypothetical protein
MKLLLFIGIISLNANAGDNFCTNFTDKILDSKNLGSFTSPSNNKTYESKTNTYTFKRKKSDSFKVDITSNKDGLVIDNYFVTLMGWRQYKEKIHLDGKCKISSVQAPSWGYNIEKPIVLTAATCVKINESKEFISLYKEKIKPFSGMGMENYEKNKPIFERLNKTLNSDGSSIHNKANDPAGSEIIAVQLCQKYKNDFKVESIQPREKETKGTSAISQ